MSKHKNIPAEMRNIIPVPLCKLKRSAKNVRKIPHTQAEVEALAASIASLGILQYPVVEPELDKRGKPTGHYLVNAGEGRRLAQLLRVKRKEIKKDALIPCIVDTEHNATEISLAENAIRSSMHPADEYEAFADLHGQGVGVEDIAARFGVTAGVVKQRLKLGAVSPALLKLYREGEMNLEQLTAFTITDDHARQEQVWADLGYDLSRRDILRALTEGQVSTDDRRVAFVGFAAYEAAGGTVVRDLFDEDGGYLADVALLNRLVREKLQGVAEQVMAEGWKWVVVEAEFDYQQASSMATIDAMPCPLSEAEESRLESLQGELEAFYEQDDLTEEERSEIERLEAEIGKLTEEVYAAEDIGRAGAFVAVGSGGKARIARGYLRAEDTRRNPSDDGDGPAAARTSGSGQGLSAALVAELTAQRTAALRNDLAQAPELALIAVTHALAARVFYRENLSCLELSARLTDLSAFADGIEDSVAGRAVAERHLAWSKRLPEDSRALWHFVASLTMDDLLALLGHCASLSLDAVRRPGFQPEAASLVHAEQLAKALPHDMRRYWQPTAANYLGRVGKDGILASVREGAGDDAARQIAGLKKQAMAQRAEQLLTGTGWLPPALKPVTAEAA